MQFILININTPYLGVRGSTGNWIVHDVSSSNASRIEWDYDELSTSSCSTNSLSEIYIPEYLFLFSIIDTSTNQSVYNLSQSDFNLNLPKGFYFDVPDIFDLSLGRYAFRISFCNQNVTDEDISIMLQTG